MSRPLWFVELIKKAYLVRFPAARATRIPVLGDIADRMLFGGDDLLYLPKDQAITINQDLPHPEAVVLPSQVVEHFIEQASYISLMKNCLCRDSNSCQDYNAELGCLFLGEAAKGINQKLTHGQTTKEDALKHVRECREARLVHLIGRAKVDAIWLGVGPGHQLLTICSCCPCCCLYGMLPNLSPQIAAKISRMPGVTVTVSDRCVGCGNCTHSVCFVDAITLQEGHAVISDFCRGCGRCVTTCPQQAIGITIEDSRFVEECIARISSAVDVS